MYRIHVLSDGKYHNVTLGARYCFTKHATARIANHLLDSNCNIVIEKFIKTGDCFQWSNNEYENGIWYNENCSQVTTKRPFWMDIGT